MQSASKKLNKSPDLKIDGVVLSQATHCKFLGIAIDESLSWKRHVSSINSKISRTLFAIKQLKFTLPKESLLTLYFSLLHPYITCGILAWGNAIAQTSCVKLKPCTKEHSELYIIRVIIVTPTHSSSSLEFWRYRTCISWRLCYLCMTMFTPNCLLHSIIYSN